ncbi:MAG: excisionase family DNA-binding protein [Candidatus Omnitrophica bacterium]|nr:excisionase family DNA-binding protein [Candidatus Omnitrophota bacterium]
MKEIEKNNENNNDDKYLTTSQAAKFCNVTRFTIRNWAIEGKLKFKQTGGGHRRILKDDLVRFIDDNGISSQLSDTVTELIPHCYDYKKFKNSDLHNCKQCLVYREKAGKCFLLIKEFGSKKVQCQHDCATCEFMGTYYSKDQKTMKKQDEKNDDDNAKQVSQDLSKNNVSKCYEMKELVSSDEHDCDKCLVFKQKADKCFLVTRQFGEDRVLCEHDCVHCEYMRKNFPKEWKILLEAHSGNLGNENKKVENDKKIVHKSIYSSGKYLASVARVITGKTKKK